VKKLSGTRLTIGFLIHHLDNDYAKALLKGASVAARELDVNLAIFPGRSLNSQLDDRKYAAYEYQHNVIYSFVSKETLDAAVISAGTIGSFVTKEEFRSFVDGFEGLPIVTTENKVGDYPCVRISGSGIKSLVNHLIRKHGRKHIAFVSGPATNADANERLGYYMEALEENGIEYDENLVAYGKFSEYCTDLVADLLEKNKGRIDAICFANDMMCKGGYKAIEAAGLHIGDDISVTGYDDSEVAVSLKPMLTTVKADAAELGSRAVREAVRLAKGEKPSGNITLDSHPVYRSSCGCMKQTGTAEITAESFLQSRSSEAAADNILSEYISEYSHALEKFDRIMQFREFISRIFDFAAGVGDSSLISERSYFLRILEGNFEKIISPETMLNILKNVRTTAMLICSNSCCPPERRAETADIIANCLETASERIIVHHYSSVDDLTFTHFLISNITKDMTVYESDEEKCFFSIVNNLYRVHLDSSYIYTYETPVVHAKTMDWNKPEMVYLRAYHDGDRIAAVTGEARKLKSSEILKNSFTPTDRQQNMVISPIFMNEEQYGIIVCELSNKNFPLIYSITPQICTAIKLTNLINQLESSLDDARTRNNMLNIMSMSDELTGIYNRRGFYVFANHILKAPENNGKSAAIIFADLDNLKKINDNFGHDNGDYAIVQTSGFIKNSLRSSDIVARIGGDEFAAFAVCENRDIILQLPERIKNMAQQHNLESDKPFNVTVSVGIYELVCSEENNIQQYMDKADAALYLDKKNKNPDIMKHEVCVTAE
jgi:diguanylate cyclase (GGDEF)-like protein